MKHIVAEASNILYTLVFRQKIFCSCKKLTVQAVSFATLK